MVIRGVMYACLSLWAIAAFAHDAIDEQIERLTIQLRKSPQNADLYFRRAELRRAGRQWRSAVRDYDAALRIKPGHRAALLGKGFAVLGEGGAVAAKQIFTRFLEQVPGNPDALFGRARCYGKLHEVDAAFADYTAAIRREAEPKPEQFLERFDLLVGAGRKEAALDSIAEGERALGPLVTFALPAIEVDLELGRYADAITRLTYFVDSSARKESWLARRADVYDRIGRPDEARADRQAAILAIQSLPRFRQGDQSTTKLLSQLEEKTR